MPEQELSLWIRLREDASAQLKQLDATLAGNAKSWKDNFSAIEQQMTRAGIALAGFGAVVTAGMGLAIKSAEEERAGIARLDTQLRNIGSSYAAVSTELERNIALTELKTGISDSEQRDALIALILATGSYQQALSLLPTVLDLAAAKQMDVASAAQLIGKVAEGNVSVLGRYGIVLKEGTKASEALAIIQQKVAGTAQAAATPTKILTTQMNNLRETVGMALMPALQNLVQIIGPIITGIMNWMGAHAQLASALTTGAAVVGLVAVGFGGLLLIIPKLITGFQAFMAIINLAKTAMIALNLAIGPVGWFAVAIAAIGVTAGLATQFNGLKNEATQTSHAVLQLSDSVQASNTQVRSAMSTFKDYSLALPYVRDQLNGVKEATDKANQALAEQKAQLEGSKVAIATTTFMLEGVTYRQQLYSQAEIDSALAGHQTIEMLNLQNDAMGKTINTTQDAIDALSAFMSVQAQTNVQLEAAKVAMGTATYMIEGITYRQTLYTQAEMDTARAAGMKVEKLETQNDTLGNSANRTSIAISALASLRDAEAQTQDATERLNAVLGQLPATRGAGATAPSNPFTGGTMPPPEWWDWLNSSKMPSYQSGGQVLQTGPALLHKGETVTPAGLGTGVTTINIYPQGSIYTKNDLMQDIRQALLQLQLRTVGTGIKQ